VTVWDWRRPQSRSLILTNLDFSDWIAFGTIQQCYYYYCYCFQYFNRSTFSTDHSRLNRMPERSAEDATLRITDVGLFYRLDTLPVT